MDKTGAWLFLKSQAPVAYMRMESICYKSVIGLYFGTSDFMTIQAIRYATAQKMNAMA